MGDIKAPHRPPNQVRLASMVRWFDVALADARLIEPGDQRFLLKSIAIADVPTDRQIEVLLSAIRASNNGTPDPSGHWLDDHLASANLSADEEDGLIWIVEYLDAQRTPSAKPRGDKMAVYRVAAALFNKALLDAQARGQRHLEGPTSPQALERALNRIRQTSVE